MGVVHKGRLVAASSAAAATAVVVDCASVVEVAEPRIAAVDSVENDCAGGLRIKLYSSLHVERALAGEHRRRPGPLDHHVRELGHGGRDAAVLLC